MTLGTVLVAQGMLSYLSPNGWLNRTLMALDIVKEPLRLLHGPLAVEFSLLITGFPFAFLMLLAYVTGIDPSLSRAAATLGRSEEHTSELQSLMRTSYAVFCLKKKKTDT